MPTVSLLHVDMLVRLVVATALGALVGYEREREGKPAGVRTHGMVALGAASSHSCPLTVSRAIVIPHASRRKSSRVSASSARAILHQRPQRPWADHHREPLGHRGHRSRRRCRDAGHVSRHRGPRVSASAIRSEAAAEGGTPGSRVAPQTPPCVTIETKARQEIAQFYTDAETSVSSVLVHQ